MRLWATRCPQPFHFGRRAILVSVLIAFTSVAVGKRWLMFQPLEVASFDRLSRLQPAQDLDERLLIVAVTEEDLSRYGWPLGDPQVADLIALLQRHDPAVIGLALYRNQSPATAFPDTADRGDPPGIAIEGQTEATAAESNPLALAFRSPMVIGLMNVGTQPNDYEVPAPAAWPADQVGFSDLVLDPDGVLRRNLLFVDHPTQPYYSFPLRMALAYHRDQVLAVDPTDDDLRLGATRLPALQPGDGGYTAIDSRGYQILLRYRNPHRLAHTVTLSQVLAGQVPADWVRGRAVLIGSTAPSMRNGFLTPYSSQTGDRVRLSGVEVYAQALSQLLDALEGRPALYRFLPQWGEVLWLLGWIGLAGGLGWYVRPALTWVMVMGSAFLGLWLVGGWALAYGWWLPLVEPTAGFLVATGFVVIQRALYRTSYDQLTRLPGRELFLISLQRELSRYRRTDGPPPLTVVFLDIDRFRLINQSFSHRVGDQVLQTMAQRLSEILPESAHLARIGGDEFAFVLPFNDPATVDAALDHIQAGISAPLTIANQRLAITGSMGLVISQEDYALHPEDWLRDAHTAMYRAKALHEDRYEVFSSTMREEAMRRLEIESCLLEALEKDQFLLYYQPIMCLESRRLVGFEALIRWCHPQEGFVSPGQFIQIAEETGLILPLGQWIFREASRQLKRWQNAFPQQSLKMSINLSRRQFHQADLVEQFAQCLRDLDLDGHYIQLEITESIIMGNVEGVRSLMQQLKELGLQLAIDDFGTGYSSLSDLYHFPTDTLKIDQSFVGRMDNSRDDREIIHTIITLARKLGLGLVAEGIEDNTQADLLMEMGCEQGQGYLFAKPLNAQEATAFVAATPR
ncbi:hypothetical protein GFS31_35020 [Leptolyngbya sp. BL0902]|nr:hypothetical protein GFS31_35020 [Leptolyngbya sp. BL0902]